MFPSKTTVISGGSVYDTRHSVLFDGTNDFIAIADNNAFSFTDGNDLPFSLGGWFYLDNPSADQVLMAKYDANGSNKEWLLIYVNDDGSDNEWISFSLYTPSGGFSSSHAYRVATSAGGVNEYKNKWVHILATYGGGEDPSDQTIYLNGVAKGNHNVDETYGAANDMGNTGAGVTIGGRYNTAPATHINFKGYLDGMAIWNAELTSVDAVAMYNGGTPTDLAINHSTNLVGYWSKGSGTTIKDSSGNGRNGTLTDGASFSNVIPG